MNCKNCGNPLDKGVKFCTSCGQPVEPENSEEINSQEPVVEETTSAEITETPVEENAFVNPEFNNERKPKKGAKKRVIAIIAVVVALALTLGVVFNLDYFKGFWVKNFGSDTEYYCYVEQKNFAEGKDSIVRVYGTYRNALTGKDSLSSKASLNFTIGEDLQKLLGSDELKALSDISLNLTNNQKEQLSQVILDLTLGDTKIVDLDVIADALGGKMYLGIPSLTDTYAAGTVEMNEDMQIIYDPKLWESLPTDSLVGEILDKYIEVVLGSIDNVTSSTETVTIDGVSEEYTILEYKITEKTVLGIGQKALQALKDDAEIKTIIKDIEKYGVENKLLDEDDDAYGEFLKGVNEAIEEIAEAKEDADNENGIIIATYVNSSHEIAGRKLSIANDSQTNAQALYYITVQDGADFATKFEIADVVSIEGKGQKDGEATNGSYTLKVSGKKLVTVQLTDYDASNSSEGIVSGKIKISPEKELFENLGLDSMYSSLIGMYDPALEIVIDTDEDASKLELNILGKDKVMLGISYNYEKTNSADIKVPNKTVETNFENLDEWLDTLDFEKLKANLKKAGLPSEYVDMFENILSGNLIEDSVDIENIEDIYDDEYDFDYDDYF